MTDVNIVEVARQFIEYVGTAANECSGNIANREKPILHDKGFWPPQGEFTSYHLLYRWNQFGTVAAETAPKTILYLATVVGRANRNTLEVRAGVFPSFSKWAQGWTGAGPTDVKFSDIVRFAHSDMTEFRLVQMWDRLDSVYETTPGNIDESHSWTVGIMEALKSYTFHGPLMSEYPDEFFERQERERRERES